jgi:hypothetical protein
MKQVGMNQGLKEVEEEDKPQEGVKHGLKGR